jgi:hypothetical protein
MDPDDGGSLSGRPRRAWPLSENAMMFHIEQTSVGQSAWPSHAPVMRGIAANVTPEFRCGTGS